MCMCLHACIYICVCVCVCVHSLSVGDVRALKQKPSPGFCLAGGFMQLSVLKEGRASLDFLYFRKTYFSFVLAHTPLPLNVCIQFMVSLALTAFSFILQVKTRGHRTLRLEARYVGLLSPQGYIYICVFVKVCYVFCKGSFVFSLLFSY